jgi:hypothetical protein
MWKKNKLGAFIIVIAALIALLLDIKSIYVGLFVVFVTFMASYFQK